MTHQSAPNLKETRRLLGYAPQDNVFTLAKQNYPTIWHHGGQRVKGWSGRLKQSARGICDRWRTK